MYKIVIFDLDDTLTDDKENVKQAFKLVMEYRKEAYSENKFEKFYYIDKKTWKDRAEGKLLTPYEDDIQEKTEWLRAYRFMQYFNNEITYQEAVHINHIYMEGMKEKVVSQEGSFEIVKYLYEKGYKIIIATNGPIIPLETKIEKLKIKPYIDTIFAAEEVGAMKPHQDYYKGLLEKANIINKEDILFIGDELEKDIKGGIENKIDTCWYNPLKQSSNQYKPKYEIQKLIELKKIL